LFHGQGYQRFEVLGLGITTAGFPLPHRVAGDAQVLGQARLRQPNGRAQVLHAQTKGIVALTVGGSLHACAPFRVTHTSETRDGKRWEVTCYLMDADFPGCSTSTPSCWMRSRRVHACGVRGARNQTSSHPANLVPL